MDKMKLRKSKRVEGYTNNGIFNIGDVVKVEGFKDFSIAVISSYEIDEALNALYYRGVGVNCLGDPLQVVGFYPTAGVELIEEASDYSMRLIKYHFDHESKF